jgi:hypothetical protein
MKTIIRAFTDHHFVYLLSCPEVDSAAFKGDGWTSEIKKARPLGPEEAAAIVRRMRKGKNWQTSATMIEA